MDFRIVSVGIVFDLDPKQSIDKQRQDVLAITKNAEIVYSIMHNNTFFMDIRLNNLPEGLQDAIDTSLRNLVGITSNPADIAAA